MAKQGCIASPVDMSVVLHDLQQETGEHQKMLILRLKLAWPSLPLRQDVYSI